MNSIYLAFLFLFLDQYKVSILYCLIGIALIIVLSIIAYKVGLLLWNTIKETLYKDE